jgi:hypothetical protein
MRIIFPRPTVIVTFLDVSVYFSALFVLVVAVLMLLLLLSEALEYLAYFCVVVILPIVF